MNFVNLPVIQVLIPLLSAPLCFLVGNKKLAWIGATLASFLALACSILLIIEIHERGSISYPMGGWLAPFGIQYQIDSLSAVFLVLICGISFVTVTYAKDICNREGIRSQPMFYCIYLLCFGGLLGILATNDIFNIYVFLEISSIAAYSLVAMGKDRRALVAAFEYLILGTIGATFILIAIGIVYSMTGSLNITDISARLKLELGTKPIKMAFAFFTVGLALKAAIFPLHLWLVNSYTNAPSFISSFLSGTATKVSIYIFIRVTYTVFGYNFSYTMLPSGTILLVVASLGILLSSIIAILQDNIKRMLAYSSIAQVGYIILGIGLANVEGMHSTLWQVVSHSIAKTAMFMALGSIFYGVKGVRIEHFEGVGKRMPITIGIFIICGLSMIGVPGTAGFIAKWHLLEASLTAGMWPVFAIIVISSFLTLIYILRIIEVAFFGRIAPNKGQVTEAPLLMLIPMLVLAILLVVFGVFPSVLVQYLDKAVATLDFFHEPL